MIETINQTVWFWIGIAVFLAIFEVLVGSFFLIWLAMSALVIGIVKWLVPSLEMQTQILMFSLISIATIVIWKKYLNRS